MVIKFKTNKDHTILAKAVFIKDGTIEIEGMEGDTHFISICRIKYFNIYDKVS